MMMMMIPNGDQNGNNKHTTMCGNIIAIINFDSTHTHKCMILIFVSFVDGKNWREVYK